MIDYTAPGVPWEALPSTETPVTPEWLTQVDDTFVALVGSLPIFVGPPTGIDDTAALQAALDAVPSEGARVYLHAGTYAALTAELTCGNPVHLIGVPGLDGTGTRIVSTATATTLLTLDAQACVIENVSFVHGLSGTRSAGLVGLAMTSPDLVRIRGCLFEGWSTGLVMAGGIQWTVSQCEFRDFVVAGLEISNAGASDAGDSSVDGSWFVRGVDEVSGGVAVLWRSGGGLRFTNNKINGAGTSFPLADGLLLSVADGASTGILLVTGNSIENFTGRGVAIEQAGTTGVFSLAVSIVGNEIAAYDDGATGVYSDIALGNASIVGNTMHGLDVGVDLDNWTNAIVSGNAFTSIASTGIHIGDGCFNVFAPPQPIETDGDEVVYDGEPPDTLFPGLLGAITGLFTEGIVQPGAGTTGERPPAFSGAGCMWYDTTLGIPIFSDGSAWRDATGDPV